MLDAKKTLVLQSFEIHVMNMKMKSGENWTHIHMNSFLLDLCCLKHEKS